MATACAAKWTATKLLVYTNVSNHASDAIGAIDSGKVSSYLFAGAELDRIYERGEVPINLPSHKLFSICRDTCQLRNNPLRQIESNSYQAPLIFRWQPCCLDAA
jgi:hypothetical protein